MGIDVIPTEAISIPDGQHTGKIQEVKEEVRGEGKYVYVDVYVTVDGINKTDGTPVVIKDGMSKHLSKGSKLGKTCMRFGLSDEQIEELASSIEDKLHNFIQAHQHWPLLTDFNILVNLNQNKDKVLTLVLDCEISGGLTSSQLEDFQSEMFEYGQKALKDELECMKNS